MILLDFMYLKYSKNKESCIVNKDSLLLKNSNIINLSDIRNKEKSNNVNHNNMLISSISNVHNVLVRSLAKSDCLDSTYSNKVIELASVPKFKNMSVSNLNSNLSNKEKIKKDTNAEITKFFFESVHKNYQSNRK